MVLATSTSPEKQERTSGTPGPIHQGDAVRYPQGGGPKPHAERPADASPIDWTKLPAEQLAELLRLQGLLSAQTSFRDYIIFVKGWRIRPHTEPWIDALQKLYEGIYEKVLIKAPPGSAKSSVVTAFLEWVMGREVERGVDPTIGYFTCTDALSSEKSKSIRDTIERAVEPKTERDAAYGIVFPGVRPDKKRGWAENEWNIERKSGSADPTFKAIGKDGTPLGHRMDTAIVMDDLLTGEAAQSATEKERLWRKYNDEFITRGPKALRIHISTRFADDDMVGRIESSETGWHILHTPALIDLPGERYDTYWPPEITAEDGKPRGISVEDLLAIRERDPKSFLSQYQALPPSSMGDIFKGLGFDAHPKQEDVQSIKITWDTAFQKKDSSSYNATIEAIMRKDGILEVVNAYQRKMLYAETKAEIYSQHERVSQSWAGPIQAMVENKASGLALAQEIPFLRAADVKNRDMRERASIVSKFVWGKQVVITEDWFPQKEAFIQQILGYTGQPPDDFVSAFVLLLEQVFLRRWAPLSEIAPRFVVSGYGWKERVT